MKIIILSILLLFSLLSISYGQQKYGLTLIPVANEMVLTSHAKIIEERISKIVLEAGYFEVVERAILDELEKEKKLQKTGSFIDSETVQQGVTKGASYLMTFEVLDFSINEAPNKKKKDPARYSSELHLQFKIVDVATSKILLNETILVSSKHPLSVTKEYLEGIITLEEADKRTKKLTKYDDTENAARENVFLTFEKEFTIKLDNFFKPTYSVIDMEEVKSKIKSITINAGRNSNIRVGQILNVYEHSLREVDGKNYNRYKLLGKVVVSSVEDNNFSNCKIQSGEKELLVKLKENPNLIIAKESIEL